MTKQRFVTHLSQRDAALNVVGTHITVLVPNSELQSYGVTEQQGPEGSGPPPHSHEWDETFYVLEGTVEFTCAGEARLCEVGALVHVPRKTVHAFRYGVGGGKILEITGQGSIASQLFTAVNDEIPVGPPDIPKVVDVLSRNGVTVAL